MKSRKPVRTLLVLMLLSALVFALCIPALAGTPSLKPPSPPESSLAPPPPSEPRPYEWQNSGSFSTVELHETGTYEYTPGGYNYLEVTFYPPVSGRYSFDVAIINADCYFHTRLSGADIEPQEVYEPGCCLTATLSSENAYHLSAGGPFYRTYTLVITLEEESEAQPVETGEEPTSDAPVTDALQINGGTVVQTEMSESQDVTSPYTASTLLRGDVTIILCVACSVIFGLGGFFLGRKKKPAPEDSAST